jgi:uncharacterized protein (DUF1330 family)
MEIAKTPEPAQFEELMQGPADTKVVMLNLLSFNEESEDGNGSGQEAYRRYASRMRGIVEGGGGRFLWSGRVDSQLIGRSDAAFHVVALVEYPSRAAFVKIATSSEVAEIGVHRAAGLAGQWLIACTEVDEI